MIAAAGARALRQNAVSPRRLSRAQSMLSRRRWQRQRLQHWSGNCSRVLAEKRKRRAELGSPCQSLVVRISGHSRETIERRAKCLD